MRRKKERSLFVLTALALVMVACAVTNGSNTRQPVPGIHAYDGALCADEAEPGRICANPLDRCPGGGYFPSRMACRLGTWRCLRDPIGSCTSTAPEGASTCHGSETDGPCDLGRCANGTPVRALRTCMNGQYVCQPSEQPVCASPTEPDAGVAPDASMDYTGPCHPGAERHCYSGPIDTEGLGQCHGSTQVCLLEGHVSRWSADCVGEVTPGSVETPYDGVDNDCNGWVDDDHRLLAGHVSTCIADRGCFWFGNSPDSAWPSIYGFQGCFSSGRFTPSSGHIHPGMLVARGAVDELHNVYYVARDGMRHAFPTATTFATWFLDATSTVPIRVDAHACASVVQVSDAELAAIPIGRNVRIHPGTIATGITTDPRRYVISSGGVLRPLAEEALLFEVQPPWITERVVMTPDFLFTDYTLGPEIRNPSTYSWMSEIGVTLEDDLSLP